MAGGRDAYEDIDDDLSGVDPENLSRLVEEWKERTAPPCPKCKGLGVADEGGWCGDCGGDGVDRISAFFVCR
jgi:hypothetical protein